MYILLPYHLRKGIRKAYYLSSGLLQDAYKFEDTQYFIRNSIKLIGWITGVS